MLLARASTAVLLGGILLAGCHVHAQEPVGYVEVTSAPVDVYAYPSVVYAGRPTYWVNGRWIYRDYDRNQWLYYRREPDDLYRQRPYLQQAPPAYPQRAYPQQAPPAYPQRGYPQQPTYPPPGVRVQ